MSDPSVEEIQGKRIDRLESRFDSFEQRVADTLHSHDLIIQQLQALPKTIEDRFVKQDEAMHGLREDVRDQVSALATNIDKMESSGEERDQVLGQKVDTLREDLHVSVDQALSFVPPWVTLFAATGAALFGGLFTILTMQHIGSASRDIVAIGLSLVGGGIIGWLVRRRAKP